MNRTQFAKAGLAIAALAAVGVLPGLTRSLGSLAHRDSSREILR